MHVWVEPASESDSELYFTPTSDRARSESSPSPVPITQAVWDGDQNGSEASTKVDMDLAWNAEPDGRSGGFLHNEREPSYGEREDERLQRLHPSSEEEIPWHCQSPISEQAQESEAHRCMQTGKCKVLLEKAEAKSEIELRLQQAEEYGKKLEKELARLQTRLLQEIEVRRSEAEAVEKVKEELRSIQTRRESEAQQSTRELVRLQEKLARETEARRVEVEASNQASVRLRLLENRLLEGEKEKEKAEMRRNREEERYETDWRARLQMQREEEAEACRKARLQRNKDKLVALQVRRIEKKRKDQSKRQRKIAKRLDRIERLGEERLAEEKRAADEEAVAKADAERVQKEEKEKKSETCRKREEERREADEPTRLQMQREEEAEARRKAKLQQTGTGAPAKAESPGGGAWRRTTPSTPTVAPPIRQVAATTPLPLSTESPATPKYVPGALRGRGGAPASGGGWNAREASRQGAGTATPKRLLKAAPAQGDGGGLQSVPAKKVRRARGRRGGGDAASHGGSSRR